MYFNLNNNKLTEASPTLENPEILNYNEHTNLFKSKCESEMINYCLYINKTSHDVKVTIDLVPLNNKKNKKSSK